MLLSSWPHAWALLAGAWLRGLKFQFGSRTFKKLFLPHFMQWPLSHWSAGPCRHGDMGCARPNYQSQKTDRQCVFVCLALVSQQKKTPNWLCLRRPNKCSWVWKCYKNKPTTCCRLWNTSLYRLLQHGISLFQKSEGNLWWTAARYVLLIKTNAHQQTGTRRRAHTVGGMHLVWNKLNHQHTKMPAGLL